MRVASPSDASPRASASRAANTMPTATASPCERPANASSRSSAWPERVPVVQEQASAVVALVLGDRPRLRRDAAGHDPLERGRVSREDRRRVSLQHVQELDVQRQAVLRHLRQSRAEVSSLDGCASVSTSATTSRGCENVPTRFLPSGRLTAGLAADRRVDLRQQRGRHLDERHAAHVRRGDEPGEIADRSPSQRDHRVVPMRLLRRELMQQRLVDLQRLGRPRRRAPMSGTVASPAAPSDDASGSNHASGDRPVGHHERGRCARELREQRPDRPDRARADADVVRPPRDRDGHADQRSSSTMASATSPGVPVPSTTWAANSR